MMHTMKTYRAAYLGSTVLTRPEDAHLSDEELLAEAHLELDHVSPDGLLDADGGPLAPRSAVKIGLWTEK